MESFDPLSLPHFPPSVFIFPFLPYSLNDSHVFLVSQTKHIKSLSACMSHYHPLDNAPRFHQVQFIVAIPSTMNGTIGSCLSTRPYSVKLLENKL